MSYAGMAAQAVGGELQGWASVLDKRNMGKAFQDEMARQQAFRGQGYNVMAGAIPSMGREQAMRDMALGNAQRQADYARIGSIPLGFAPAANAATAPQDKAYGQIRGSERAALGQYSDWSLQQAIRNLQTQQALNKISSFAGGDASVFPLQMYKAQHSMDDLAMIGSAISSLGGGASNFAQFNQAPQMPQQQQNLMYGVQPSTTYGMGLDSGGGLSGLYGGMLS